MTKGAWKWDSEKECLVEVPAKNIPAISSPVKVEDERPKIYTGQYL